MKSIPKIIHFVFLNTKEPIPEFFKTCLERAKAFHPDWKIVLYNEYDAINIISEHLPELLPVYSGYAHYIQRADMIRAVLVYVFGGFYMDLDMFCLKPIDRELLNNQLILPEERSVTFKRKKLQERLDGISIKYSFRLGNYMFGGIPKHPFWLFYFKEGIQKAQSTVMKEGDILETTGPSLLTNVYHKYRKLFPEITVLKNYDRECLVPYHHEICCHFGNYAAHIHQGTWRWEHQDRNKSFNNQITYEQIEKSLIYLKRRIRKTHLLNISFIHSNKDNKDFATAIISKQIRHSIKNTKTGNRNQLFLNLKSLSISEEGSIGSNNTLIITEPVSTLCEKQISLINRHISRCIVFNPLCKETLHSLNVKTQIEIMDCFYLPVKRDFSESESELLDVFHIGIYSDISGTSLKVISDLIVSLKKFDKSITLTVLFQRQSDSKKLPYIKGVKFLRLSNNNLFKSINSLSCFFSLDTDLNETIILKTCLYLGIPAATKTDHNLNNSLLRYCEKLSGNNLSQEIIEFKKEYHKHNIQSLKAAKYIEDRFSLENISHKIISRSFNL